jgi:hypothetical protein
LAGVRTSLKEKVAILFINFYESKVMRSTGNEELILKFRELLYSDSLEMPGPKKTRGNENSIQEFMELNSELIPTPRLMSGGLFCESVISKYPVSHNLITDFVFVSVASGKVQITLVELENSVKKNLHEK